MLDSFADYFEGSFLRKLMYGEYGLFKTFWFFNFAINIAYIVVIVFVYVIGLSVLETPITILYFAYTPFVIMGVWTAAKKYQGLKLWSVLAQSLVLLGIINFVRSLHEFFGGLPNSF